MRHIEVGKLATEIGNDLQDAADDARTLCATIGSAEQYEDTEGWIDEIRSEGDELVSTLDILAGKCAAARDAVAAALCGAPVPS